MITVKTLATRLGISPQRVRKLAANGRILGAVRLDARRWILPDDATISPPSRNHRKDLEAQSLGNEANAHGKRTQRQDKPLNRLVK